MYAVADQPLRDALDLAYLTGQRPQDVHRTMETDIREGVLFYKQGKTEKRVRFDVEGALSTLLTRIKARKEAMTGKVRSLALLCNEKGQRMGRDALRYRFDKARRLAAAACQDAELKADILKYQFRDLRAKAGTDKTDSDSLQAAQRQLGHKSITTTERYVRDRLGDRVKPTK